MTTEQPDLTNASVFYREWKTNLAKAIAEEELGRDWNDCGAYERQAYLDEAQKRIEQRSDDQQ